MTGEVYRSEHLELPSAARLNPLSGGALARLSAPGGESGTIAADQFQSEHLVQSLEARRITKYLPVPQ
jgi:hypothetical protein